MSELINDAEQAASAVSSIASAPSVLERYGIMAVATLAACAISFGSGYLYRAHVDSVKQATQTAVVKTADAVASATVATADTKTDTTLQRKLTAANARAASLQQQIEAARNANPPAPDCRLPDGLLSTINSQLAGHPGQVQAAVQ
jgi:predicted phage tail protein